MKRKFSLFSLLILPLMLLNGCNAFSNRNEFIMPSSSSLDSTSYSSKEDYEKALYNRIIMDYYEQILCINGFPRKEQEGNIINVVNNGYSWKRVNSNIRVTQSGADNIDYYDISLELVGESKEGAYVCLFGDPICPINSGFEDAKGATVFVDGTKFFFGSTYFAPFVWYQGTVFYPCEAFLEGIIGIEDIYNQQSIPRRTRKRASFELGIKPVEIKDTYVPKSIVLNTIKNDYCEQLKDNNVTKNIEWNSGNVNPTDVHIIDDFGTFNDKRLLVLSCIGLSTQNSLWNTKIVMDDVEISPFNLFEPDIYIDNNFYSLSTACERKLLTIEELLTIEQSINSQS